MLIKNDMYRIKTKPERHVIKPATSGPQVITLFSCSTQLSIVGILTFISLINTTSESLKARKICILQHFSFHEQLEFMLS